MPDLDVDANVDVVKTTMAWRRYVHHGVCGMWINNVSGPIRRQLMKQDQYWTIGGTSICYVMAPCEKRIIRRWEHGNQGAIRHHRERASEWTSEMCIFCFPFIFQIFIKIECREWARHRASVEWIKERKICPTTAYTSMGLEIGAAWVRVRPNAEKRKMKK